MMANHLNFLGRTIVEKTFARWLLGAAMVCFAAVPQAFGGFLVITALEVEEGTYYPGDPVPIMLAVTNTTADLDADPACYDVQVHLTPDTVWRDSNDHLLHYLVGSIGPGQTVVHTWTQMMPGNLPGTFFVNAEVTTCHPTSTPAMTTPPSRLAFESDVATARITLAPATHPETELISVAESGVQGNRNSEQASISDDGRFVAFASDSTTLLGIQFDENGEPITDDDDNPIGVIGNNFYDIFVKDHWTGEIERISVPMGGTDANGPSFRPRISGDGRWVVFHSDATNLVPGDSNGSTDVFLKDRHTGSLRRVSVGINGAQGNQNSQNASISADGRWIVFESEATNLTGDDINGVADIFLYDAQAGKLVRRVNVTSDGMEARGGHSRFPRISANGRHITFESRATNLTSDSPTGLWEIYVHDRNANETYQTVLNENQEEVLVPVFDEPGGIATRRLSVSYDANGNVLFADGDSHASDLSHDGRYVVFHSEATQLSSKAAEGAILLPGRAAEATVSWNENTPGFGTITFASNDLATGAIGFLNNPVDGEIVEIRDGVNSARFEFDGPNPDGVGAGNIQVIITGDAGTTRDELLAAVNKAFGMVGEDPGTILATPADNIGVDGQAVGYAIVLTNLEFGPPAANQPINVVDAPNLVAEGMDGAGEPVARVESGDQLEIDHGRTAPVTIEFFASGDSDPTDVDSRIIGVQIGNTPKGTSKNLLEVFEGLGYHEFDADYMPALPDYLLPPLMVNPVHGTSYTFVRGEDEDDPDYVEATFVFVDEGPQFNPLNPQFVRIGLTPEETRGNLIRAINALGIPFAPLPATILADGTDYTFGLTYSDAPARGAVALKEVPEDGSSITISDGITTTTFRFDNERDLTDEEEDQGITQVPPFEIIGPGLARVYLINDITLAEITNRFIGAIQASYLDLAVSVGFSAELDRDAIILLNNRVGAFGNVPITINPLDEEEEDEEPPPPNTVLTEWADAYGMTGGDDGNPAFGDRLVFYPENLLHPAVVFEFVFDIADVSPDADFAVPLGFTGATTEGNLLAAIHRSGIPWLVAEGTDDVEDPTVRLRSIIGAADGTVSFNFHATNPDSFVALASVPGQVRNPFHRGRLTLDDGLNPPVTYEFTFDGSVSNEDFIPVDLAPVGALTRDNLINAINQTDHLAIRAEDASEPLEDVFGDDLLVVRLINTNRGVVGEIASGTGLGPLVIQTIDLGGWNPVPGDAFRLGDATGNSKIFQFVGPGYPDADPGNIAIPTPGASGDDRIAVRNAIVAAIKDSGLKIRVTEGVENGAPAVFLVQEIPGPAGNVPIVVLSENPSFTVRGMSGGAFLGNGFSQVYLVDRDSNGNGVFDEPGELRLELISITEGGLPGNESSMEPAISGDGKFVAFRTMANDLQPRTIVRSDGQVFPNRNDPLALESDEIVNFTDVDSFSDVYVRDRETGVNTRVSVNRFGENGVGGRVWIVQGAPRSSRGAAINFDGRYIAFESDEEPVITTHRGGKGDAQIILGGLAHTFTNRNPIDDNHRRDVFLHDRRFDTILEPLPGLVEVSLPDVVYDDDPLTVDTLTTGVPVDIIADVSGLEPGREVSLVAFFANGSLIDVATQPAIRHTNRFVARWAPPLPTTYHITAVAIDTRGRELPMSDVLEISATRTQGISPVIDVINPPIEDELVPDNAFVLTNRSLWPFVAGVASGNHTVAEVEFFIRELTPVEVEENTITGNLGGVSMGKAVAEPTADNVPASTWRLNFDFANSPLAPSGLPPGYYAVRAVSRDTQGNHFSSQALPILVMAGVFDRPTVRLTSNRREFNREEFTRFRAQVDSAQGQIDVNGEVWLFASGSFVDYPDFNNPDTERPYEWEGLALFTGVWNFYAVARDSTGNTSMSNVIQIVIHPSGHVVRNPADPNEHEAFISLAFDALLGDDVMPSTQLRRHYLRLLESGQWTRGHLIRELMTGYPEFQNVPWVIATYLTLTDSYPTRDELRDGLFTLDEGDEGGQDPEDEPDLGPSVPLFLPALVSEVLQSDTFLIKHRRRADVMTDEELLKAVYEGKTHPETQRRLTELRNEGRSGYFARITAEKFDGYLGLARRAAVILLMLNREVIPGEVNQLPDSIIAASNILFGRPDFTEQYSDSYLKPMFVPPSSVSTMYSQRSLWLGDYYDRHFNYAGDSGWIVHKEHDWLYFGPTSVVTDENGAVIGAWVWDNIQRDWLWTTPQNYSNYSPAGALLYSHNDQRWIFYRHGGTPAKRQFQWFNSAAGTWSPIYDVAR